MRGHLSDIYDLAWSPDSKFLLSGSVDNTAIIWNIEKAKGVQKFQDHSGFVQGVTWDPKNKYISTLSTDRSAKIYQNCKNKTDIKFFHKSTLKKFTINEASSNGLNCEKSLHFFSDELKCPSYLNYLKIP